MYNSNKTKVAIFFIAFLFAGNYCNSQHFIRGGFQGGGHGSGGIIANVAEIIPDITEESMISYPNPFDKESTLKLTLSDPGEIDLTVYNLDSRQVRSLAKKQELPSGEHLYKWDGKNEEREPVAKGTYFYRLVIGKKVIVRKIILL